MPLYLANAIAAIRGSGNEAVDSINLRRTGRNTNQASSAAAIFIIAATKNTLCHPPELAASTLDSGTRSDAVPLAVYSRPAFAAAYLLPKVSALVDGNRL